MATTKVLVDLRYYAEARKSLSNVAGMSPLLVVIWCVHLNQSAGFLNSVVNF
jgi:hypothetical protein